MKQLKFLH